MKCDCNYIIAIVGCVGLVVGQMVWYFIDMPQLYNWCDAGFKAALLYSFSRVVVKASFSMFLFLDVMFNLALTNLIDELFFKPESVEVNEYICLLIVVFIAIFRWLLYSTKLTHQTLLNKLWKALKY